MADTELNMLIKYIKDAERYHLDNAKKGIIGSGYKSMAIQDILLFVENELAEHLVVYDSNEKVFRTSDGNGFYWKDDAIKHEKEWLRSEIN